MPTLKDAAINVMVLLMFLNAGPNLIMASGVGEDLGITPTISDSGSVSSANSELEKVQPTGGFGSTLFGLYTSLGTTMKTVLNVFFGGWIMLVSAGLPTWLANFIFAPQYLFVGGMMIYLLAGRLM